MKDPLLARMLSSSPSTSEDEYIDAATPLDWAQYEIATVFYDFRVHEVAQDRITDIMKRLYESTQRETKGVIQNERS